MEEFHNLKVYYRNNLRNQTVVLLREYPQFLSSVDSDLVEHWGSFPGSSDLLHLYLEESGKRILTQLERKRIETRTRSFLEQLSATLSHPEFGRMDLSIFPLFLLNALRVLIFSIEFRQGRWQLPLTAAQVVAYLAGQTPLLPAFPDKLLAHYEIVTQGKGRFDERLMPKSRALLAEMLKISQGGRSWESLKILNDMPDEHRLKISAVIITANRPLQLERCLQSLVQLTRPPEELLVVDNGKDASARRVVDKFQAPFPIQYLNLDQVGVARGRNVAARVAQGEIIAFVDDDAAVTPHWLENLERVFLRDPHIGLAAGSILNMKCGRKDMVWKFMEAVEKI